MKLGELGKPLKDCLTTIYHLINNSFNVELILVFLFGKFNRAGAGKALKLVIERHERFFLSVYNEIKLKLLRQPLFARSLEYANNRIYLYSAQKGLCAVTGEKFTSTDEIHCHHKIPKSQGGTNEYQNLILVTATVHKLIHATNAETIQKYLQTRLQKAQCVKTNYWKHYPFGRLIRL